MNRDLLALATLSGILPHYTDPAGRIRATGPDTARALLAAMGIACASDAETRDSLATLRAEAAARVLPRWLVVAAGQGAVLCPVRDVGAWRLELEDGTALEGAAGGGRVTLPPLAAGYHTLELDGQGVLILAAPTALPLPPRGWGVTLPLYGLRTAARGGFGDFSDLARAAAGLGAAGAGFVGINPVHAGFPADPHVFSPYTPSSRRQLNVLHVAVPGADGAAGPLIDYGHDIPAKRAALHAAYDRATPRDRADLEVWRRRAGPEQERFALHQALSARHGPYWTDWPAALRDPDRAAAREGPALAGETAYHCWLQWQAEAQLLAARHAAEAAGMAHGLYLDLAVGTHPSGAETWSDPDQFARGVSLGAPPDAFATEGQTWNLAPLIPHALAADGFRVLARTLRAQFRFARLLRIDHILGFDRAFWVPGGGLPGAYVAMPRDAMLAVVRIEAARAGATVVGEDLGNVPDGLRDDLAASGILGCRVAIFEQDGTPPRFRPAHSYPTATMASFSTHDLPTWEGWREGRDIGWWRHIGSIDATAESASLDRRTAEVAAFGQTIGPGGATAMHRFLADSGSALVALQIENVLEEAEQPNLPGTTTQHPNWRRRVPVAAAGLGRDPRLVAAAALMGRAGR